jgi:hypothetical protein
MRFNWISDAVKHHCVEKPQGKEVLNVEFISCGFKCLKILEPIGAKKDS